MWFSIILGLLVGLLLAKNEDVVDIEEDSELFSKLLHDI